MRCVARNKVPQALAIAGALLICNEAAEAFTFNTPPDWDVRLDNSVQYTTGWRVQRRNNHIGDNPINAEADYKFDRGDMVTNRIQDLIEFEGIYRKNLGFRVSGSIWKDFAYDDKVKTNPNPAFASMLTYPTGHYTDWTKRWHLQGGELLDAFLFLNTKVGETPVYLKAGRVNQYWGNSFFFGYSAISYSQSPIDGIKAATQPGSEIKELFLPRAQILATAELSPRLAISGQYFFEFDGNRYAEAGTYLAPADILFKGPRSGGPLNAAFGGPVSAGSEDRPDNNNRNYGVKLSWSPDWAAGDLGFYYRQMDEVHPWAPLFDMASDGRGGRLHLSYAQKVKLAGVSYEANIAGISTGFEVSYRRGTALNSTMGSFIPGVPTTEGAKGDIVNVIANMMTPLNTTWAYDSATLIAELSYTHLRSVTENEELFYGEGHPGCANGSKWHGCSTKNALALAVLFDPAWNQVLPGLDLNAPMSATIGLSGLPAYAAGQTYAQQSKQVSLGIRGTYRGKHSLTLSYIRSYWKPGPVVGSPLGDVYAYASGPAALNDKGWVSLTFKTSF